MVVGLVIALVLVALLMVAAFAVLPRILRGELGSLRQPAAGELAARNADVDRRLQGVIEIMDTRLGDLDHKVDRRLETAGRTAAQIHERLGEVARAAAEMNER